MKNEDRRVKRFPHLNFLGPILPGAEYIGHERRRERSRAPSPCRPDTLFLTAWRTVCAPLVCAGQDDDGPAATVAGRQFTFTDPTAPLCPM